MYSSYDSANRARLPDEIELISRDVGGKRIQFVVLRGEDASSLFDCGLNGFPLVNPGLNGQAPRTLVISHADADHFGNAAATKAAFPEMSVLAHAADQHWIEQPDIMVRERYDHARERFAFGYAPAELAAMREACGGGVSLDGVLNPGDMIELGAHTWQVLHVPGHSPGHIALWDKSTGVLLLGDAAFGYGIPGADGKLCMPPTHQFIADYLQTIQRLEALSVSAVLSGHFPVLDGQQFRQLLRDSRDCCERDLAFVRSQAKAGPATFAALMQRLNESFRQWPTSQDIHYSYALSGYIEHLEQAGEIHAAKGEIHA